MKPISEAARIARVNAWAAKGERLAKQRIARWEKDRSAGSNRSDGSPNQSASVAREK